MRQSTIFVAGLLGLATAAPLKPVIARLPRSDNNLADILPSDITDLVSAIVDKVPVDVSVSLPVIPERRHAAAAVDVDLGGTNLSIKKKRNPDAAADNNLADILPSDITDLASGIVDKVPVDVSVSLPVLPERRHAAAAVDVDLGGTNLSIKKKRNPDAAVDVDLGGTNLSIKKRNPDAAVDVDLGGTNLSIKKKRNPDAAVDVDLGGTNLSI